MASDGWPATAMAVFDTASLSTPLMTKTRDTQIDIARGIAIFLVVYAHIATGLLSKTIYLFHMPFFFMVSGYFHKVEPQEGKYLRKKALSLLVPYFVYLLLLKWPILSELLWRVVTTPSVESAKGLLRGIYQLTYGGTNLTGTTGVFWFITCLFLTQQLFNFIRNRVHSCKAMVAISLGLYGTSCLVQPFIPDYFAVPWCANAVGCAFLFYAAGALYGQFLLKQQRPNVEKTLLLAAVGTGIFSIVLLRAGLDLSFGMKHGYYGVFVLSPLAAFGFTKLLTISSAWIAQHKWLCASLSFMGSASLTIMYVHRLIEYNLPKFLQGSPFFEAVVITIACCLLHQILLQSAMSKALLLGAFNSIQRKQKQPALELVQRPSKS